MTNLFHLTIKKLDNAIIFIQKKLKNLNIRN